MNRHQIFVDRHISATERRALAATIIVEVYTVSPVHFTQATPCHTVGQQPSGQFAFHPISNELSIYRNYDDAGNDRGRTLQIVSINSLKLLTSFCFEFTADLNWDFSYANPFDPSAGKNNHDYYIELSIVKPLTGALSVNVQRIIATFEAESINQVGLRLSF